MTKSHLKLIMELIFIFIIPLLIICISIDIKKNYTLDENGNTTEEIKTLDYNNILLQDTLNPMYNNYLDFNQSVNNFTIDNIAYGSNYQNVVITNDYIQFDTTGSGYIRVEPYFDATLTLNNIYITQLIVETTNNIQLYFYPQNYNYRDSTLIGNQLYTRFSISNIYNAFFIGFSGTSTIKINRSKINLYNLTKMFGLGYEPSITEFNTIFPNDYYQYTTSEIITYKSNSIISVNNSINYTPIGAIKQLIEENLHINDNLTTTILFDYTILWFIMFIIWHFLYLFFDGLVHIFIDWGSKERKKVS